MYSDQSIVTDSITMGVSETDIKSFVMLAQCCLLCEHAFSHLCHQVVNNVLIIYVLVRLLMLQSTAASVFSAGG